MQVSNNNNINQTSFGMRSVVSLLVEKEVEELISSAKPDILEIGHPSAGCLMTRPEGNFYNVVVKVVLGNARFSYIGEVWGRVKTKNSLLKLVRKANADANESFVMHRLPKEPSEADFIPLPPETVHALNDNNTVYVVRKIDSTALDGTTPVLPDKDVN